MYICTKLSAPTKLILPRETWAKIVRKSGNDQWLTPHGNVKSNSMEYYYAKLPDALDSQ